MRTVKNHNSVPALDCVANGIEVCDTACVGGGGGGVPCGSSTILEFMPELEGVDLVTCPLFSAVSQS